VKSARFQVVAALVAAAAVIATIQAQKLLITGKRPTPMIESIGPQVAQLPLPAFDGAHAIWGSTGQDAAGHLWFGVTAEGTGVPSAHLFEYDPSADQFTDRGDVIVEVALTSVTEAEAVLKQIVSKSSVSIGFYAGVYVHASLGNLDGAFRDLSAAVDTHAWPILLKAHPIFAGLRGDPRFAQFCARVGIPAS